MESTGSFTRSTAPAAATSLQPLAIRDEDKKLAQQSPSSSRTPSSASNKVVTTGFKCKYCPSRFATARGRGGHERVHSHLPEYRRDQKQKKERRRLSPAGHVSSSLSNVPGLRSACALFHPQLFNSYGSTRRQHNFPTSARSGAVPLFAGTGGLAPAQPSSVATGGGGHVGISRTGGGGHVGAFVHLGGLQGMPEVNQEETTDGIDLTLRLMPEVNQEDTTDGIDLTLRL